MPKSVRQTFTVIATAIALNFLWFDAGKATRAQEEPSKADSTTDPEALKKLIERIRKEEAESDPLKKRDLAGETTVQPQVFSWLETAHLGTYYTGQGQARFLALHVLLANSTPQAFTITREQVTIEIDGEKRAVLDLPKLMLSSNVTSASKSISISSMKPPKEWKLPAEGATEMWLIYPELPVGSNVPKCRLKIKIGDATKEFDVNQAQSAKLGLDVQRIGPRQCLALLTINGTMNSFNTGALVEELDKLVEQKVARVVIGWGNDSKPPEPQLNQWLQNAAAGNAGNPNHIPVFPVIPTAIREFHVTEFPVGEEIQVRISGGDGLRATPVPRVHKTAAESVGAALRTAFLSLPRDELLNEIKTGHPLSRAAALFYGGGRLDVAQLPQIFALVEDKDAEIQKAAVQAICHFGEREAIDKLVNYALRNVEPLSTLAIESLAGSRFSAAHDALLNLLKNEPASSKKRIVQVLTRYPRPIWSEALFEFVSDSSHSMDVDTLRALVQVGHPRLVDVLEAALNSSDKSIREFSFQELSKRSDERSESLAVNDALKRLEAGPPDALVVQLLSRTKDQRAIPLLFKQMESSGDHINTINLLLQIGDQSVADALVKKFGFLNTDEKIQILHGIRVFRHPRFRQLCGEALLSNENKLATTAANSLTHDGHVEGEKLLVAALEKQKGTPFSRILINALANFATPTARAALVRMRDIVDVKEKDEINRALALLSSRSPGFQFASQGWNHYLNNQLKEANEAYNIAIDLDPTLAEAYLLRGKLFLKKEDYGGARKDFEKVLELKFEPKDAEFSEFVTSLAIARVVDGDLAEGLKYLEENRIEGVRRSQEKGAKGLFHYNAACAYSRAVEQVDKRPDLADRESIREKYRKQAIDDLTESFKQGFNDYDYTANDPDFKYLHEDPDFKKILANRSNVKPEDKPTDDDE